PLESGTSKSPLPECDRRTSRICGARHPYVHEDRGVLRCESLDRRFDPAHGALLSSATHELAFYKGRSLMKTVQPLGLRRRTSGIAWSSGRSGPSPSSAAVLATRRYLFTMIDERCPVRSCTHASLRPFARLSVTNVALSPWTFI